jgi:carboxyl-terminal processing protease
MKHLSTEVIMLSFIVIALLAQGVDSVQSELQRLVRAQYIKTLPAEQVDTMTPESINALDEHSEWLPPDMADFERSIADGEEPFGFETANRANGHPVITSMASSGILYKRGIAMGDAITAINGRPIHSSQALKKSLMRSGHRPFTMTIRRGGIDYDVDVDPSGQRATNVVGMLYDTIAYINIAYCAEGMAKRSRILLQRFRDQGARRYVVDLRGNPGGYLHEGISFCELFSRAGDTIILQRFGNGDVKVFTAKRDGPFVGMTVDILVDVETASCSELIALAGQDRGWARVVGTVTYGKGVMQSIDNLSDGSMLSITSAEFLSRRNVSIDNTLGTGGVEPDQRRRWVRYATYIRDSGASLAITPAQLAELRRQHPNPSRSVIDSLRTAWGLSSSATNSVMLSVFTWARLGMVVEAVGG